MINAIKTQTQRFGAFFSYRIVKTNALNEATIATIARIRNNDVVERAVFCAATCKTNYNHRECLTN